MAKVINPVAALNISKRVGKVGILRIRKEGKVISAVPRVSDFEFLSSTVKDIIKSSTLIAWEALSSDQRLVYEQISVTLLMTGFQLFSIQRSRAVTSAKYGRAQYGGTVYGGILPTIYGKVYGVCVYGVAKYGKS